MMLQLLGKILLGPGHLDYHQPKPALQKQQENLKKIWENDKYSSFGIERVFRLFLASCTFAFPGIYIRHWTGKKGLLWRKLGVEAYVLLKLFVPLVILISHTEHRILLCV